MDPVVIGAIIAGGAALGSSVINATAKGTHPGRRKLNRQKELAAYNQSLLDASYEKYQSPSAMMRQYEEAGLNPNLVYGQAGAGGPGVAQVDSSAADYDDSSAVSDNINSALNGVLSAVDFYQNYKSKQIANTNAQKTGDLITEQTEAQRVTNEFNKIANTYKVEDLAESVANKKINNAILKQTGLQKAKNEIAIQKEQIKTSKLTRKEKRRAIEHYDKLEEQIDSVIAVNKTRVKEMEQAMKFAKDYHPYKLASLAISNMLGNQAYTQSAELHPYKKVSAAYDNAIKHQKLTSGETLLPYQIDAMTAKTNNVNVRTAQTQQKMNYDEAMEAVKMWQDVAKAVEQTKGKPGNTYTTNNWISK